LTVAGGKGANLGELMRGGFPVPPGFALTTAAYDRFVTENQLGETIGRALAAGGEGGAQIRAAFEAGAIPSDIERVLREAYGQLGEGAVAVRSSATAEDLADAAFAGQQDTFLNILGLDSLLDAVRRCWASLWTDRAITYRDRQSVDQESVRLAVVVQRMVPAETAGVLFTANPVSGARDEVVVDASPGLGEAVVSGLVTPDHFVLRTAWWGWSVAERRPGKREIVVRARAGGGTEHVEANATTRPLPDRALRRLARLGKKIEAHFGSPQDIEWTWSRGQVAVVQARPITALPQPRRRLNRMQRQMLGIMAEVVPQRPYPLDLTGWGPAIFGAIDPMFKELGLKTHTMESMFIEEDGLAVRASGRPLVAPGPRIVRAPLAVARLAWRYDSTRWQEDPELNEMLALASKLDAADLQAMSWTELLTLLHTELDIPRRIAGEVRVRYFPRAALATGLLMVTLKVLRRGELFGQMTSGVETKTMAANRELEALADSIRADSELSESFANKEASELWATLERTTSGAEFLAEFRSFLGRYGCREAFITGASQPTWGDGPGIPLGILKGLASAPPRSAPERPTWESARDQILTRPVLRIPSLRSRFLAMLGQARILMQIREDTHFFATLGLPLVRHNFLEMGRRLVDAGVLATAEDVFYLKLQELERVGRGWPPSARQVDELRAVASRRKQRFAELAQTPLFDPRLLAPPTGEGGALVSGMPGSPGLAQGPVRIVRDGREFGKLRPGEILVAPFTNPAWTPLFQRAAAVVVDAGGAASHAAIVAREYHIPAIMGTGDGTSRLVDGQIVRVDGDRGLVFEVAAVESEP
jgi:phosphohistidine swiveling domain-containing protein